MDDKELQPEKTSVYIKATFSPIVTSANDLQP